MIIPEGFAQANIKFAGVGLPTGAEITLGLDIRTYAGTPLQLATEVLTQFQLPAVRLNVASEVTISSAMVKYGPAATGASAEYSNPLAGQGVAAAVSSNTAWLVKKVTAFGGRTGRGRFYFPGIPESVVTSAGVITAGNRTSMENAMEAMRANLTTFGASPVVLHGASSPVATPRLITAFSVDSKVATQRRRMRR